MQPDSGIMRLLCPAKINLHLRIGPLRGDGFHPLLSWFCTAGLFDTLTIQPASALVASTSNAAHVTLACDRADLPVDDRNLVVKVGKAWARESGQRLGSLVSPVNAVLQKQIPAGAGLGGGSSDGARMLAGLNALWKTGAAADELSAFAARFGSDLSFFFHGPSSVCKGRGEIVEPCPRPLPRGLLLCLPPIAMPTADVYRRFDAMKLGQTQDVEREPDWQAWSKLNAHALLANLVNDLEAPAFAISPALATLRQELENALRRPVRMSGSGSSLFTLFDTVEEAERAKAALAGFDEIRLEAVTLAPDFADNLNAPSELG